MSIEAQQQHKLPPEVYFAIANAIEGNKDLAYFASACRLFRAVVDSNRVLYLKRLGVYDFAFGKVEWVRYFGDIGEEPPLPVNIAEILNSQCPIWPDKKVKDTHMLTLIPSHVNGEQLTIEGVGELVKSPKGGGCATKYDFYKHFGNEKAHVKQNTWVLMTRDVLPNSLDKSYKAQCQLVAALAKSSGQSYEVPHLIEAVTSIFMEYVKTGNRLYSDDSRTYTRCQKKAQDKGCVSNGCWWFWYWRALRLLRRPRQLGRRLLRRGVSAEVLCVQLKLECCAPRKRAIANR